MIEKNIQSSYVMDFLCRRQDGLGYREVKCTTVNNNLFIPSDLLEFVKTNSGKQWKSIVKKNGGDEKLALDLLMEEIKARLKEATNVAVFFNRNRAITFQGENIQLIYVSGSELRGDVDFKKNIFSAAEEVSYTFKMGDKKVFTVRPDVSFFVNGIFLGYMELKSPFNGQSAEKEGRGKVIMDYMEAVQEYAQLAGQNDEAQSLRREMLRIFENSIHLVASDINQTFVLRNVAQFCDELRKGFTEHSISMSEKKGDIEKTFKNYPELNSEAGEKERFEATMRALYSKPMIEKEILYYNFLQYEVEKRGKKKERKSNRGRLISPRPKQKFGCDKIIDRIQEFLEHEKEPDYFLNKLRTDLLAKGASQEKAEEIVAKRAAYCNNKYVYSLLLQYAAGFGKSNIIGWTALQLKDLRHNGEWVYDKILLVVDRLQLRDQLDTMMMSMNIDKAMFIEATNAKTFIQALQDKRRIIVVNIQKFIDMQEAIKKAQAQLKSMRVAFLIDEIHRSNTGTSHEEMMNLFDELQDTFDASEGELLAGTGKKNLIVGFTATPSEKVLARFGELSDKSSIDPIWVPFDSYSMKEAIKDGYILDPTKHIIAVPAKMYFELPEGIIRAIENGTEAQKFGLKKDHVYENHDRMMAISSFVVNRLLNLVYTKIRGTGKAMLAVSSIPIAIEYCTIIRRMMDEKTKQTRFARYKDAPVAIVYSDNQDYQSSKSMNDGKPEETVIRDFKNAKNGLIIVVDKLQTGFDEPKLHTLFLDKEIHDINAIQTISRVDRTCKYKEECHIVDFSFNNENVKNIQQAFLKYSDIVVSDFNAQAELAVVEQLYKSLKSHELFAKWFRRYTESKSDIDQNTQVSMDMTDDFRKWIKDAIKRYKDFMESKPETLAGEEASAAENSSEADGKGEDDAKRLRSDIGSYTSELNLLEGVLEIDPSYTDEDFLDFWRRFCEIYRDVVGRNEGSNSIIVEYDGSIGLTVDPELEDPSKPGDDDEDEGDEDGEEEEGDENGKKRRKKGKSNGMDIIGMLEKLNSQAETQAERVEYWYGIILQFFAFLEEESSFVAKIQDEYGRFDRAEIEADYKKLCRKFKRLHSADDALLNKFFTENEEELLELFLEHLQKAGAQTSFNSMKAISLRQPEASLVIAGIQDVINQSFPITELPTTILVHASNSVDHKFIEQLVARETLEISKAGVDYVNALWLGNIPLEPDMPRRSLVGYATIVDCIQDSKSPWAKSGQYHWVIGEVHEFVDPISDVRGEIGLFDCQIDEQRLSASHVPVNRFPRIEGKNLLMPVHVDFFDTAKKGDEFVLDSTQGLIEILCPNPKEAKVADLDTITLLYEGEERQFELKEAFFEPQVKETGEAITYLDEEGVRQDYYLIVFVLGKELGGSRESDAFYEEETDMRADNTVDSGAAAIEPDSIPEGYQGRVIPMRPTDVPKDIELQFDDPHLTKDNCVYLTLQQEYFEEMVAGTKKVEYREVKTTTYKKFRYLCVDDRGYPIPYSNTDIDWPLFQGADLNVYNHGKFPFLVSQNINFLRIKAGATAHDMDSLVVEVDHIELTPFRRFDIINGKRVSNPKSGEFCEWWIEFHLGKIRSIHRKAKK